MIKQLTQVNWAAAIDASKLPVKLVPHSSWIEFQKKKSIIDDLRSKEKTILGNVQKNPEIWNNESLKIILKPSQPQNISSSISVECITQVDFQFENYLPSYFEFFLSQLRKIVDSLNNCKNSILKSSRNRKLISLTKVLTEFVSRWYLVIPKSIASNGVDLTVI